MINRTTGRLAGRVRTTDILLCVSLLLGGSCDGNWNVILV